MALKKYVYPDGEVYEGWWNENGLKHGVGKLCFTGGSCYEGQFKDGFASGLGCMMFADGSKFEGEFQNGKYHGLGTYLRTDGMIFEGHFQEGKVCGFGLATFSNGKHGQPRCEGYFEGSKLLRGERATDIVDRIKLITAEAKKVKLSDE